MPLKPLGLRILHIKVLEALYEELGKKPQIHISYYVTDGYMISYTWQNPQDYTTIVM